MTQDTALASNPPAHSRRDSRGWQSFAAGFSFLLAALLTIPAIVGFWGNRTLMTTTNYVNTVAPLASDARVQRALATKVSDIVADSLDVNQIVSETLGAEVADSLAVRRITERLQVAIPGLTYQLTSELLDSPRFPALWDGMNRTAHAAVLKLLTTDGGEVAQIVDGQLVLDLSGPISAVQDRLVESGIPQSAITPVPASRSQVEVMDVSTLAQVRTVYRFVSPTTAWLIVVVGVLYVLAWGLANRRRRMLGIIGVTLLLSAAAMAVGLTVGQLVFTDALSQTFLADASAAFYATLLRNLQVAWIATAILGVVLMLIVAVTRPRRAAGSPSGS